MVQHVMTEYDIIQAISGTDDNGFSKCTISLQPQRCDSDGHIVNTDEAYVTDKPVVNMFKQAGGYILLDLVFESVDDVDLVNIYGYLQDFFNADNSTSDDELDFPLFLLTLVPDSLNGEYFALGVNPIFYALAPDDVKGEPKILRMVFVAQDDSDEVPNFLFMKSDEEILDDILAGDEEE